MWSDPPMYASGKIYEEVYIKIYLRGISQKIHENTKCVQDINLSFFGYGEVEIEVLRAISQSIFQKIHASTKCQKTLI